MPAGLPGATSAQNQANPSQGAAVIFDLLSGPKGSPFDNDKDYANAVHPFWKLDTTTPAVVNTNCSTGALSTGIGFGPTVGPQGTNAIRPNFTDDYKPGISTPTPADSPNSSIMYIGGGRMIKDALYPSAGHTELFIPNPYTAGFGIGNGGNGGSRDAGAGPAFTGFGLKMVTAAADIANGAAIETGWVNRSGVTIMTGQNEFGSATAASAAPTVTIEDPPPPAPPAPPPAPEPPAPPPP